MSVTLEKWANKFGLDQPGRPITSKVNAIDDGNYFESEEDDAEEVLAMGKEKEIFPDCGLPGHGDTNCNVNVNFVLARKNMNAKPHVAKSIEAANPKYIRRPLGPRRPQQKSLRPNGKASSGSKSGGRKFGKVTQVDLEDEISVEDEDGDSVEEDVTCLRLDDDSDVEEQFVLLVETCLPDDFVGLTRKDMHLNY